MWGYLLKFEDAVKLIETHMEAKEVITPTLLIQNCFQKILHNNFLKFA